jgi:DNA end-binding protein Ku
MVRSIWSGTISFGLVSVPVTLSGAVSAKEVRFHLLHEKDGARIREKRVCSAENKEVPYQQIAKGYELSRGRYVMVTQKELEAAAPEATHTIDIEDFVQLDEIDPIYYQHTYYLIPDRGGAKAYGLLREAMKKTNRVAIARFVLRSKQYLCALRPLERAIVLSTMLWADEVVAESKLEGLSSVRPSAKELAMAKQLIGSLESRFQPEKYADDYRERVLAMIGRKAEGKQIVAPESAPAAQVVNLVDALKASLGAHDHARKKAARRPRHAPHRHHATRKSA